MDISLFHGLTCDGVRHDADAESWCFAFQGGVLLQVSSTWRIVTEGRIALARDDDGQQFGLSARVSGASVACALLVGKPVERFTVAIETSDVRVDFVGGVRLEVLNDSSGYEAWEASSPAGLLMVGQGGGNLVRSPPIAH